MATYTITTPVNVDSLTSKAGSDTYNINGFSASCMFDQHTRFGLNGNTSAGLGTIQPSATLGGDVYFDARFARLISFNTGTGTVPADGTTISKGSASGKLVGVYSALNVAPTAAGAAMPASGYILLKQWNSVAFSTGALTGVSASLIVDPVFSTTDRVGWVEIIGTEGFNANTGRLNNPVTPVMQGDWINIGITDGNRSTTYQIPSNGVSQYHAGVYLTNPTSASISAMTWSDATGIGYVTATSTSHGFLDGDYVTITGSTPSGYNVTRVRVKVINANSYSFPLLVNPGTYTSGATAAGQPEFIPVTTTAALIANMGTDHITGKWCWIDVTTGLVRFGHDGTNSTGGWLPPSGRTVRMPNLFLQSCTAAARTANSHNATLGLRYFFNTTNAGVVVADHFSSNWRWNVLSTGKGATFVDCGFSDQVGITTMATAVLLTRCGISAPVVATNNVLTLSNHLAGVTAIDSVFSAGEWNGAKVIISSNTANNLSFSRCRFVGSGARTSSSNATSSFSVGSNYTFDQCLLMAAFATSQNSTLRLSYITQIDSTAGNTQNTFLQNSMNYTNKTSDVVINGYDTGGLSYVSARASILAMSAGSTGITFKNMGTYDNPIALGAAGAAKVSWTRSAAVATVTSTAHGLRNNDIIFTYGSSSQGAIASNNRTVTVVDANTFTIPVTNGGLTSGTVSYYIGGTTNILNLGSGTGDIKVQNVHARYNYGTSIVNTNVVNNLTVQNFSGERLTNSTIMQKAAINFTLNSAYESSYPSLAGGAAIYGSTFEDNFIKPPTLSVVVGASWTRSTSTILINSPGHGLLQADRVWLYDSTAPTGATNGSSGFVTVIDEDNFQYTGINTGAGSGTISYRVEDSRLLMLYNEANSSNTSLITIQSGSPAFTGAGSLVAPNVGDQITFEMPSYIKGYDSFPNIPATLTGTSLTQANFDFAYAIDAGSGFGSFHNLNYNRSGASGSSGANTVTITSVTGVETGDYVYGTGIADGATVSAINTGTNTLTLSIDNTAAVSGTLIFNHLPAEGTMPSTGFKLKIRQTTNTANAGIMSVLWLPMSSTTTTRNRLYDQSTQVPITITVLRSDTLAPVQNARIYITADTGGPLTAGTVILTGVTDVNGQLTSTTSYTSNQPIVGWARNSSLTPFFAQALIGGTITSSGYSTTSFLVKDE